MPFASPRALPWLEHLGVEVGKKDKRGESKERYEKKLQVEEREEICYLGRIDEREVQ